MPDDAENYPLIPVQEIERLRAAGYVIVPLAPNDDMTKVGAPSCFTVPDGSWEAACRDANECFRAMIDVGSL